MDNQLKGVIHVGSASVVVESELVEVNGKSLSVIFDESTDIVSGEVFQISKEISTVTIDGEDAPLIFMERI